MNPHFGLLSPKNRRCVRISIMKSALILFPHQLFATAQLPQVDTVVLVEDPLYFGLDQASPIKLHKQKLILHRASMRRYVEELLWPLGVEVDYVDLDVFMKTNDVLERVKKFDHVYIFDPIDDVLTKRLLQARREREGSVTIEFLPSPNFYLKEQEIRQYLNERHTHVFDDFYQWQRERFNILIGDNYKPLGGKWNYEASSRESIATGTTLPTFEVFGNNKWVAEATDYVNKHFPDNPGSTDFDWPTSHVEAATWLHDFVEHRLDDFGTYQDTLDGQAAWLYHSALSSSLNIGLLSPQQVIEAVNERHAQRPVPMPNLETFVRQVIGWREFMRGLYILKAEGMRSANPLKHQRKLTDAWYDGSLGMPPFDDVVHKLNQRGYVHQGERLMIAANLMLLCEIHPDDMYRWFSELFVDSYDWAMLPNVYEVNRFIEGGAVGALPISASNYILQLSHYERGEWSNVWDGLYWRFVEKHRDALSKNPKTRAMVQRLDRLDADHRRIIHYRAEDFLNKTTR